MIPAVVGAIGFGTRLPVGVDDDAWTALTDRPGVLVLAAVPTGLAGALAVVLPGPSATVAIAYLLALVAVGGITHLDGLADCADGAAAHGSPAERRAIVADTAIGVGGTLAIAGSVAALVAAGLTLANGPAVQAAGIVLASEATASVAMVALAVGGSAATDGLGATVIEPAGGIDALIAGLIGTPLVAAAALAGPLVPVAVGAGGTLAALAVWTWARRTLGGLTGDVLGASHATARICAVHAGVIVWTVS
ncbi:adenosylcobinamide-GDP ribazoletransferase [Halococcoides cellulosivorans]|uniref:Adenosylcobinamide-GDP ribazoletransferase n=1 Tax=Halococcoides cellulosivorans TaxID=1679096 RepID=A0A2R4X136_9EURY|nr:adenosylcobinamide-GDP ribazoletransferase [Halococcoides cellulosivorans]AWB27512.1 adenosylcobinamide-GDP ribazoletransferase [Halococcoides cellulosivorans]